MIRVPEPLVVTCVWWCGIVGLGMENFVLPRMIQVSYSNSFGLVWSGLVRLRPGDVGGRKKQKYI